MIKSFYTSHSKPSIIVMEKKHLEEVLSFIRQHRSNEANFEKIYSKLQEEVDSAEDSSEYKNKLQEINQKQAAEYQQAKKDAPTAWPEFENFIAEFETTITAALKSL